MLIDLKSLFVYKKPKEAFEFTESLNESDKWDELKGDKKDKKNEQSNKSDEIQESIKNNIENQDCQNDKNDIQKGDNNIQKKLTKIMEKSQNKNEKNKVELKRPNPIETIEANELVNDKKNKNKNEVKNDIDQKTDTNKTIEENEPLIFVDDEININKKCLENIFHIPINKDVVIREFNVAKKISAFVIYIDGMIDGDIIVQFTLPQLMNSQNFEDFDGVGTLDYIEKNVLTVHQITRMKKFEEIVPQILSGQTAIFIDGCDETILLESRGYEKRGVSAPVTETVVHGSQEGFTENLRTNITLIRRLIKSENLITEFNTVTKTSNSLSAIMYMEGIVNPKIVEEVKMRVTKLNIDYVLGAEMVKQLIEDNPKMLLPQIISTERPDRIASFLMEGKVVLVCEGTPFVLSMPITFFDLYHTSEDANLKWQHGSFLRIIRLMGLILAIFLPGMYTALILFHQEMIPTALLSSIVVTRRLVPFPTILELILMEFSFELIREGGIRVPGVTGNTLGIIGALILGQAAVEAGLVSPIMIIIVAVSGLGSFAIPNYSLSLAVRIVRFLLIIFGFIAGFYGISAGITIICAMALGMKSFGVPYFAPISPVTKCNEDNVIRGPLYDLKNRPDYLNTVDNKRMGDNPRGWTK